MISITRRRDRMLWYEDTKIVEDSVSNTHAINHLRKEKGLTEKSNKPKGGQSVFLLFIYNLYIEWVTK